MGRHPGSLSVDVMRRILGILCETSPTGRTSLSFRSRLNYGTCVRYISFFEELEWVNVTGSDNPRVTITPSGRQYHALISRYLSLSSTLEKLVDKPMLAQSR